MSSPLSMQAVVERLSQLGTTAARPTHHHGLLHVEVAPLADPFSPVLHVAVESRPAGSFISAQLGPSDLLRDFGRVVRLFFTLCALSFATHFALLGRGPELVRALAAIGAVWAGAMALFGAIENAVRARVERDVDDQRILGALRELVGHRSD